MIAKLQPNRVRRSYLGGSRIDDFCGTGGAPGGRSRPVLSSTSTLSPLTSHLSPLTSHLSPLTSPGAEQPRPEDWLASTTQAFNGTLEIEGEGLGRLEDGRLVKDVVGSLPILVKLLDSDERLVVQAHPTVPCARRLFGSPVGKTECWYFLPGTAPDACVYLGFKPGVTRTAWEQAVRECSQIPSVHKSALPTNNNCGAPGGRALPVAADLRAARNCDLPFVNNPILSLLHRITVKSGDFVFVDGGVPHAIGGGCFMVELQEPSDLMVVAERFTPSGRRIPDAKMHGGIGWDRMFDVYEYEGRTYEATCARYVRRNADLQPEGRFHGGGAAVLRPHSGDVRICGPDLTDKFQMWRLAGDGILPLNGTSAVVVVTDGAGTLNGLAVKSGDRLVVSGEASFRAAGGFSAIACFRR